MTYRLSYFVSNKLARLVETRHITEIAYSKKGSFSDRLRLRLLNGSPFLQKYVVETNGGSYCFVACCFLKNNHIKTTFGSAFRILAHSTTSRVELQRYVAPLRSKERRVTPSSRSTSPRVRGNSQKYSGTFELGYFLIHTIFLVNR